jgi:hypothetical protein
MLATLDLEMRKISISLAAEAIAMCRNFLNIYVILFGQMK